MRLLQSFMGEVHVYEYARCWVGSFKMMSNGEVKNVEFRCNKGLQKIIRRHRVSRTNSQLPRGLFKQDEWFIIKPSLLCGDVKHWGNGMKAKVVSYFTLTEKIPS